MSTYIQSIAGNYFRLLEFAGHPYLLTALKQNYDIFRTSEEINDVRCFSTLIEDRAFYDNILPDNQLIEMDNRIDAAERIFGIMTEIIENLLENDEDLTDFRILTIGDETQIIFPRLPVNSAVNFNKFTSRVMVQRRQRQPRQQQQQVQQVQEQPVRKVKTGRVAKKNVAKVAKVDKVTKVDKVAKVPRKTRKTVTKKSNVAATPMDASSSSSSHTLPSQYLPSNQFPIMNYDEMMQQSEESLRLLHKRLGKMPVR